MYIKVECEHEAAVATSAIASLRYYQACTCDFHTGYVCDRCERLLGVETAYEYETFMERYSDLIYNKRVVRSPEEQGEASTQPITQVKTPVSPTPEGEICPTCDGTGKAYGNNSPGNYHICSDCSGSGKLLLT